MCTNLLHIVAAALIGSRIVKLLDRVDQLWVEATPHARAPTRFLSRASLGGLLLRRSLLWPSAAFRWVYVNLYV